MTALLQFRTCRPGFAGALVAILCLPLLFRSAATAQSTVRWTTNFYSVKGMTIPELRQSIRENRPWKQRLDHDAMTDWRVNWQFTLSPTDGGCRVSTFTTQTTITITMPRWMAPTNAPETTRQIWQRYIDALGQHEAGHGAMALAAAAELNKRAQTVGGGGDCDALKSRLNGVCQQVIEEHRAKDRAYDEKTRHGATQGAVLPGGRRPRR